MHPANLIAKALRLQEIEDSTTNLPKKTETCCVTGQVCECIPRKEIIPKSNCDQPFFLAPTSQWCGIDAALVFSYRPERASCWWTDGNEFRSIKRQEVRLLVLNGSAAAPWSIWVTTSYKKHGSIRAKVNYGARGIIAFDELLVDTTDGDRIMDWWKIMTEAQKKGIGRTMQESVSCPPGLLGKVGLSTWMEFEAWAKPKMRAPLYSLLCYLLPSLDELKSENMYSSS